LWFARQGSLLSRYMHDATVFLFWSSLHALWLLKNSCCEWNNHNLMSELRCYSLLRC
jgi:hypothetical protein